MDAKKLSQKKLEDIKYRFATMRDRADAVVEAATELAECFETIERYSDYATEAKEEQDFAEAAKYEKYVQDAQTELAELQKKLNHEFYGVRLDFFVNDAEDLL